MKLDADEKELLDSVDQGEWKSAKGGKRERARYSRYAKATFRKDRRLNIRLSSKDLEAIHAKLRWLLADERVTLDGIYFCPHRPDDRCNCRKPAPGMIDRAVAELRIDLDRAYVIGDSARDIELAKQVGVRSLLVLTGPSGKETLADLTRRQLMPDYVADALPQAVEWILAHAIGQPAAARVPS